MTLIDNKRLRFSKVLFEIMEKSEFIKVKNIFNNTFKLRNAHNISKDLCLSSSDSKKMLYLFESRKLSKRKL